MKDAEKARKLLDVISVVASNVVEKRLDNVVQTKLAYVTSITYNTNGNAIYRVMLSSSNSDEFECPKLCINELSVGDYVWLNYIGDITNAYIAMPVEPSPAQDVIRNTVAYNLLDNSDFTNPVNQRGQTSYTGDGYTIDRWSISNAYSNVNVANGGVVFSAEGGTAYPRQLIDFAALKGKTVTAAVCLSDGSIYCDSGTIPTVAPTEQTVFATAAFGNCYFVIDMLANAETVRFLFTVPDGESITLKWAALYEGEYTTETVPKYMPKGYAAELAECQRYFCRFAPTRTDSYSRCGYGAKTGDTTTCITLFLPVKMREGLLPTVVHSGASLYYYTGSGEDVTTISSLALNSEVCNLVSLVLTPASSIPSGSETWLQLAGNGYLDFSKDL